MRKGTIRLGNELWRILRASSTKYGSTNMNKYERELYFALELYFDLNWNLILTCTVHIII